MTQSAPQPPDNDVHRTADDSEIVYFDGSPKAIAAHEFPICIFIALVIIAASIAIAMYGKHIALIGILCAPICLVVPLMKAKSLRYKITNYRVDCEHGVASKTIDTLELWHVEDIQFHQSLWARMLGVGTISILSHDDTTPRLTLWGLPKPRELFDDLKQRIIAVKRQRGVVKMDTGT
jgi:hypothetical protein